MTIVRVVGATIIAIIADHHRSRYGVKPFMLIFATPLAFLGCTTMAVMLTRICLHFMAVIEWVISP